MTCEVLRLLFDYYREKAGRPCPIRPPGFSCKLTQICVTPTKPLRRKAFLLDGLITPTLKAAGSNPVGRTKTGNTRQSFAGFTSSFLFYGLLLSPAAAARLRHLCLSKNMWKAID